MTEKVTAPVESPKEQTSQPDNKWTRRKLLGAAAVGSATSLAGFGTGAGAAFHVMKNNIEDLRHSLDETQGENNLSKQYLRPLQEAMERARSAGAGRPANVVYVFNDDQFDVTVRYAGKLQEKDRDSAPSSPVLG